jgi:hypothetical protein
MWHRSSLLGPRSRGDLALAAHLAALGGRSLEGTLADTLEPGGATLARNSANLRPSVRSVLDCGTLGSANLRPVLR